MSRRPHPESRRQRAKALGVSPSTLARWDKGATPRKPRPVVESCEPSDIVCEVPNVTG
jgi:hypothetical protein